MPDVLCVCVREDPLHQAPCTLASLRLRHHVHRNVACGVCQRHELNLPARQAPWPGSSRPHWQSSDLSQDLALEESADGPELVITRDLRSAAVLHSWPLMYGARSGFDRSWNGAQLAVAHGGPEYGSSPPLAGVQLVDTRTGEHTAAELRDVEKHKACPPLLSDWSSRSQLLALRWVQGCAGCTVSVLDSLGRVLRTASFPDARPDKHPECWVRWAPDGVVAVLHLSTGLYLWQPGGVDPPIRSQRVQPAQELCFAWSCSAKSRCLATVTGSESEPKHMHIWSLPREECVLPLLDSDDLESVSYIHWGTCNRVAVQCVWWGSSETTPGRLAFYRIAASDLVLVRAPSSCDTVSYCCSQAALSPDGTLLAVAFAPCSRDARYRHGCDIFGLDGHLLLRTALLFMPRIPGRIVWAVDGARLLVLDKPASANEYDDVMGDCRMVLDFS